jgi:signal transduction histidine kinase
VTAFGICGWLVAFVAIARALALGWRLELVADAEHELRGPLAALTLAAARRGPIAPAVVEGQLDRALAALADLTAARRGQRAPTLAERQEARLVTERAAAGWAGAGADVTLDWDAGDAEVEADGGRISQALGNLLSNAIEHGGGQAHVRGVRCGRNLRIEVSGRGRGLAIATQAVEDAGGRLGLAPGPDGMIAAIELPLADA